MTSSTSAHQITEGFLDHLWNFAPDDLPQAVASGLSSLDEFDRERLIRQLIHRKPEPIAPITGPGSGASPSLKSAQNPRPGPYPTRLIREVIRQVGADDLIEGLVTHADTKLLACLSLSDEQALQVAWKTLVAVADKTALQIALAQQYPDTVMGALVAGFWGFQQPLPPSLTEVMENWLIATPEAEAGLVTQLVQAAWEYQGAGDEKTALDIWAFGRTQATHLAKDLEAAWVEHFGGEMLAHRMVEEAFDRVQIGQGNSPLCWSPAERAELKAWTARADASQLAVQAASVMTEKMAQCFTPNPPLFSEASNHPDEFAYQMAQAILHILDREQIEEPWRTVWRTQGPLQGILTAAERSRDLQTRPPAPPSRPRRRS